MSEIGLDNNKALEEELYELKKELKWYKDQYNIYKTIFSILPWHVYWKNTDGIILDCNLEMAKSAGFSSPIEIIGKTDYQLPWKDRADAIKKVDLEVINTGKPVMAEEKGLTFDNRMRIFLSKKEPLFDKQGKVIGIVGISFDVTDERDTERKLNFALKSNSYFISKISHDIHGSISNALSYFDTFFKKNIYSLLENINLSDEKLLLKNNLFNDVKLIYENLKIPLEKIDHVIYLMEIKSGKFKISKTATVIDELVDNSIIEKIKFNENVKFEVNFKEKMTKSVIILDLDIIQRILLILISNAAKHTYEGKITVTIETVLDNNLMTISVKDTGVGFIENRLETVFKSFVADDVQEGFDKYVKSSYKLPIVKGLLDILGGEITIKSDKVNGTEVIVSFPYEVEDVPVEQYNARKKVLSPIIQLKKLGNIKENIILPKYKVVLVEDDELTLNFQKKILENIGCYVIPVKTGSEFLKVLKKEKFDIVFFDITLDDMTGIELAKKTREKFGENVAIFAITSHSKDKDTAFFMGKGISYVLSKPVTELDLRSLLESYTSGLFDNVK